MKTFNKKLFYKIGGGGIYITLHGEQHFETKEKKCVSMMKTLKIKFLAKQYNFNFNIL